MVDLFSTPSLVTIVLGAVALLIPIIDALNKEKGSKNKVFSGISFGSLGSALIIVITRVISGETLPALSMASNGVITDDVFGAFFLNSLSYCFLDGDCFLLELYEKEKQSCRILFFNTFIKYRNDPYWLFNRFCDVVSFLGVDVNSDLCIGSIF